MSVVPVPYGDIAKPTSDLLTKDYPVGNVKLEVKTTAPNGVQFTVNGAKDNKSGAIAGDLKGKWSDPSRGMTVTETWTTSNVLTTEVELENSIAKGMKLILNGSLLPSVGQRNAKATAEYKQDNVNVRSSIDLFRGPTVNSDIVVGSDGFLLGGEAAYDVQDAKITKYNTAAGYNGKDYSVALTAANAFNILAASYFHKVAPDVEAGAKAVWDKKTDGPVAIEVGSKYLLDRDAFVKAKVNNAGILGLGYTQNLRPGVKLQLGGNFDTTRLNENVHKLGMNLAFDG